MAREDCATFLRENNDLRCKELHTLINNLYNNLNSFKSDFNKIIRNLKSLLEENLIDQEMFDDGLHIIKTYAVMYLNDKNSMEALVYHCSTCNKYFLEKDITSFLEEIPTKKIINYASEGFCSRECRENYNPIPAERIIDNPK